jgi:hypothetical protein
LRLARVLSPRSRAAFFPRIASCGDARIFSSARSKGVIFRQGWNNHQTNKKIGDADSATLGPWGEPNARNTGTKR